MPHELKDFRKDVEQKRRDGVKAHRREMRQVAQAEVPMSALTGSKEWDYFLSILQAEIDDLENGLLAMRDGGDLDPSFEYADLVRLKAQKMLTCVQIDTLQRVRDLPQQIISQGEKAKLALRQYADE